MRRFLLTSAAFLGMALLIAVGVFIFLSLQLEPVEQSTRAATETGSTVNAPLGGGILTSPAAEGATSSDTLPVMPSDGIPLRDLPLSETQRSILSGVGVDVETFIITPAVQVCAEEKLGADRMMEIVDGDAPSVIETTRLLPCLGVD